MNDQHFACIPKSPTGCIYLLGAGGLEFDQVTPLRCLSYNSLKYQVPKPLCSINGIFTAFSSSQVAWSQRASNSQSQIVRASMRRKWISAPQHRCATESSRGLELRQIEMITMPRATCYYLESKHVFQFTLTGMWKKRSEILIFSDSLCYFDAWFIEPVRVLPFLVYSGLAVQWPCAKSNQIRSIVFIENGMAFPLEPLLSVHSS